MALYRENATGFVQEHASNPGSGYTLISSQPTDTIANRVTWWRDVDKGSLTSAWHPSLQTGDPESPAPDDGAGRGINILPNDYASFEWPAGLPPTHTTNATISQQTNRIHGEKCARVTLSSAGGVAWLSASGQFNILLTANRKWIMSWFVKPSTAVARTASIRLTTATATYTVSGTTDGSTSWQRLSGVFDLTADAATEARIGLSLDTTGVALDFDGLMLEEQIGRESDPSPFYSPWGFGSVTKPEYWPDYGIPTIKLYSDLQARINLIDGASSLDGSVNKRLADQYTGLVQQINQVSVGNGQFDSKIIFNGTPFNKNDVLYESVESGAWHVNVWPVCERFPCTKEEFCGSWEDRFTYEFVQEEYRNALLEGTLSAFMQEYMLRISSEEERLVQDGEIRWYSRIQLLERKSQFNFYITTDFATKGKQHNDFSVISVWAYNANGDWFWVDGICKKQTMDKNIDDLFRLAQMYSPQSVGVEISGQQGAFIQWIQNEMMTRNIWFNLANGKNNQPGIQPDMDKLSRFNLVLPWFKAGKMYFPQELRAGVIMGEFVSEMTLATISGFKSKHDDCLDTISQLAYLKAWKPSEASPMTQTADDRWAMDDEFEAAASPMSSYIV